MDFWDDKIIEENFGEKRFKGGLSEACL
jgi:hypothetical protein